MFYIIMSIIIIIIHVRRARGPSIDRFSNGSCVFGIIKNEYVRVLASMIIARSVCVREMRTYNHTHTTDTHNSTRNTII